MIVKWKDGHIQALVRLLASKVGAHPTMGKQKVRPDYVGQKSEGSNLKLGKNILLSKSLSKITCLSSIINC